MLTIFTVPLPFQENDRLSQYNAIVSWTLLRPRPEILLLGDEAGTLDFARQHGIRHVPDIDHTEDGYLSIRSIFALAQQHAKNDIIALVDADVILMDDFMSTVSRYTTAERLLLAGYRRAITIDERLDFASGWDRQLRDRVNQKGFKYHAKAGAGSDYFVFHKGLLDDTMPDFSLGKGHWDGWMMWHALDQGCELIDCTATIFAVHQNHKWRVWRGGGSKRNLELTGGNMHWVFDATTKLEG